MGKKNRDSGASRRDAIAQGGVRNAGVVRDVSRNINRERAYQMAQPLPELDLSAFHDVPIQVVSNLQQAIATRPAGVIAKPGQGRQPVTSPVKAKLLVRPPARSIVATPLAQRPGPAQITKAKANQAIAANRDHLPALPSEKRKENVRLNCKQRPEPTKSRGPGGSRSYVPWCKT